MLKRQSLVAVLVFVVIGGVSGITVIPAVGGASAVHAGPTLTVPGIGASSSVESYNWAGYAANTSSRQVTAVSGSWTEPAVKCTSKLALAAFWVGIDGYSSSTVEQTGTLAQCSGGVASYYAWWEMYPTNSVQPISTITVHAGDRFGANVTYSTSTHKFTLYIIDTTTGASFTKTKKLSSAVRSSAECIAEAPSGDSSTVSGIYPLANFKTVTFSVCDAVLGGTFSGIGGFSSVTSITMVSYPSATRTLASTSSLTDETAFTVTWHHYS